MIQANKNMLPLPLHTGTVFDLKTSILVNLFFNDVIYGYCFAF